MATRDQIASGTVLLTVREWAEVQNQRDRAITLLREAEPMLWVHAEDDIADEVRAFLETIT